MVKINNFQFLLLSSLLFQILSLEEVKKEIKNIKDMKSSVWNSIDDGFYPLEENIIKEGHTIIAFSDVRGDGYTDIITYTNITENGKENYSFYKHAYDKENFKFSDAERIFYINDSDIQSIRNLYIGRLYGDKTCYLASFNKKDSSVDLLHYIKCGGDDPKLMAITSNILILNRKADDKGQILFNDWDGTKKICVLGSNNYKCDNNEGMESFPSEHKKNISLKGGVAYVDVLGNCAPDIILSYENGTERYIEIYFFNRRTEKYVFGQNIHVGNATELGAFTISRIKNEKDTENAPQLDILIPNIANNQIIAYKNIIKNSYEWSTPFCDEDDNKDVSAKEIFVKAGDYSLSSIDEQTTLDDTFVTVIRPGDFLMSGTPGLLVKHNLKSSGNSTISLYKKEGENFEEYIRFDWKELGTNPRIALFFDINESGALGLIIQDTGYKNHFYFNYRKDTFFIKSKLMNDDSEFSDMNLGASYRYIVTDQSGDRHMDISYQLAQTSDMNIPLPYSLVGLGETNNYVENFQIISGNYYGNKNLFEDEDNRNFKFYTPIIPNTQMKLIKFKNKENLYEWSIDLIVEPMESLYIIALVLIGVMLVILGVIIYLHYRELQEEKKEMNKFKSWFA